MTLVWPVLLTITSAVPQKLAVAELDSPDSLLGLSLQVARQVTETAIAQKWSVTGPEELRVKLDAKSYTGLRKCGGQPVCVAQYLTGQGIKKTVTGVIARDERNYLVKLWLVNLETGQIESTVDRQILIASRRLQRDVQEALPGFLRGEKESLGNVLVEANVKDVQVFINGEFVGLTPTTLRLKTGKYDVKLDRKRYFSLQRFVDVDASKPSTVHFDLQLKPGEVAEKDDLPPMVAKDEARSAIALTAPTWIFGSVTLVAVGAGAVFGTLSSQQVTKLRAGYEPTRMTYEGTRAQALEAQRNAVAANVAFGVAGAAAIATTVFLVLDLTRKDEPNKVTVSPQWQPGVSGVSLSGRF